MPSINRANIFKTGTHNRRTFTEGDLDNIVAAFNELKQSGRIPLKAGHNPEQPLTDGQPALGWVKKVWREGPNLYADFVDIPQAMYAAIQKNLYRYTSIELLVDAEGPDGRAHPYVLDAVALLGADPPAVQGLEDLQRLAATRAMPAMKFSSRLAYSTAIRKTRITQKADTHDNGDSTTMTAEAENKILKAKLEKFEREKAEAFTRSKAEADQKALFVAKEHQRSILERLEQAVREKRILPAHRAKLIKAKRLDDPKQAIAFSRADVDLFTLTHDRKDLIRALFTSTALSKADDAESQDSPVDRLSKSAREIFARGNHRDIFHALNDAVAQDPAAFQAILEHDYPSNGTVLNRALR